QQPARSGAHGFRSHRSRSLLTLHRFCRIRVNSYERTLASPTLVVNGARDQFFSGSRFSLNQYGHVCWSDHANDFKYPMHLRSFAEHTAEDRAILEPAAKMADFHVDI